LYMDTAGPLKAVSSASIPLDPDFPSWPSLPPGVLIQTTDLSRTFQSVRPVFRVWSFSSILRQPRGAPDFRPGGSLLVDGFYSLRVLSKRRRVSVLFLSPVPRRVWLTKGSPGTKNPLFFVVALSFFPMKEKLSVFLSWPFSLSVLLRQRCD